MNQLGPTLLALTANAASAEEITAWARGEGSPAAEQTERLLVADECFSIVEEVEGADVARAWFIGQNTGSDEISPAEAICAQEFDDVRIAARRMASGELMGW